MQYGRVAELVDAADFGVFLVKLDKSETSYNENCREYLKGNLQSKSWLKRRRRTQNAVLNFLNDGLKHMISTNEKYHITEVICKNSKVTQKVLREYLKRYSLLPYICENCKCDGHWQNGLISLELDHKDGDNTNNELSNLRYLCPNCHALTDTYRGRNKKKASSNTISENEFVEALQTTSNIRQALLKLGLAPAGANYSRAKELLEKYQIIQK